MQNDQQLLCAMYNKMASAMCYVLKMTSAMCYVLSGPISKKPTYMNNMTRRECTNIFAVRFRMLKVNGNYKNKYMEKTCRWCKDNMETLYLVHIYIY